MQKFFKIITVSSLMFTSFYVNAASALADEKDRLPIVNLRGPQLPNPLKQPARVLRDYGSLQTSIINAYRTERDLVVKAEDIRITKDGSSITAATDFAALAEEAKARTMELSVTIAASVFAQGVDPSIMARDAFFDCLDVQPAVTFKGPRLRKEPTDLFPAWSVLNYDTLVWWIKYAYGVGSHFNIVPSDIEAIMIDEEEITKGFNFAKLMERARTLDPSREQLELHVVLNPEAFKKR